MFIVYAVIGTKAYGTDAVQNYLNIFSDIESARKYFEKAKEIILKENEDLVSCSPIKETRGVLKTTIENEKVLIESENHLFTFTDKGGYYKEVLTIESHGIDSV